MRYSLQTAKAYESMGTKTHRLREEKILRLKKICKDQGIKVTPQRLEIFLEVIDSEDHPSAEDVFRAVRARLPTISLDTVYRTLATFDRYGLISKVHFFEDRARFDPNTKHHHHMVCTQCKRVMDFQWPELEHTSLPAETEQWGHVHAKHLQVLGTCSECLARNKRGQPGKAEQDQESRKKQE